MGIVCIVYGEINEGWAPSFPPPPQPHLDPPLASLIEVANVYFWLYDTDEDLLMNSTN